MLKQLGLRSEIVIQLSLLMIAAIVFISLLLMKQSEQDLLRQRINQNISLLQIFAETINPSSPPEKILSLLEKAESKFLSVQKLQAIAIADLRQTLASVNHSEETDWPKKIQIRQAILSGSPIIESDYGSFADQTYLLVTLPLKEKIRRPLAIQARFSLDDIRPSAFKSRNYVLLYVTLCGLILILFGSYLLERTIVRPIQHVEQASTAIAHGELDQHIPTKGPRQIAQLANSFNTMSKALKQSQKETQDHIHTLESLNRELKITQDELVRSEKMASIGILAAGMAHEIGNPLGALIGYLDLLNPRQNHQQEAEIIDGAKQEAARIDHLVRDLLDYAQPENNNEVDTDPQAVIQQTIKLLSQQQDFYDVAITSQIPANTPHVKISAPRLQQVIINLLVNARDAGPAGSSLKLNTQVQDKNLVIEVSDQGEGIPEELLTKLFDPFYTTKPPGKGQGLGLFISHRIITDAHGTLQATNNPAGGATFTIRLPLRETT